MIGRSGHFSEILLVADLSLIFEFMSLDDSQEEDCTVYIEELKSDNPSLKLNAAGKIAVIGAVLGHARVRDELIPYLIEIIEQMDNDNDFLLKVADGILELKGCTNSPKEVSNLIYPLRVLASLDQPPVRDRAVECLQKLAEGEADSFYQTHYYPLIQQLTKPELPYAPKIAACFLLPSTYPHLPPTKQAELRSLFKSLGLEQSSPLIRRAVAENIEAFGKVVQKTVIAKDFQEIWQSLIVDTFDIIRIKALECAVVVARALKKDEVTQRMFKPIKLVDSSKKSWRVRYSLAENLVPLAPYLEKDALRKDVVEIFEELLRDQEAEVRAIALIKLPEITVKLSQQQSWTVFFPHLERISKQGNKQTVPTVKLALVEAIVPFFRTVEKEKVLEGGLTVLAGLLKDENHSIRIGAMQRVIEASEVVGPEGTAKHLIPLVQGCLGDKKWRFKLAIAQSIPSFFKTLPYQEHQNFLDKVLTTFFKDHNYAVREQTIKSLVSCKDILSRDVFEQLLQKHILQMAGEPNYIYRTTACNFLKFLGGIDRGFLGTLLEAVVQKLENEKIANVLVSLFLSYPTIKNNLPQASKKAFQSFTAKVKEEKQDEDVLYYASKIDE